MLLISNLDFTYAGRRETQSLFIWTVLVCTDNSYGRVKDGQEVGTLRLEADSQLRAFTHHKMNTFSLHIL